jgi:hypothetical protein
MSNKWDEFVETPSKKFGFEVPTFTHRFIENIEVKSLLHFIVKNIQ